MTPLHAIAVALSLAFAMGWQMLWALVLGFAISGAIQAVVSHREMAKLLPDDRPATIVTASALGAASSSCSYAAVAIARSMVRKGGDFTAAMVFQFASTNLVLELGLVLAFLLGWRFTAATWAGGLVLIVLVALLMKLFFGPKQVQGARRQADKGIEGRMEGHAADMGVPDGPLIQRLLSAKGLTTVAHYFIMDWASLWTDIAAGLLIAGAIGAWVPPHAWSSVFLTGHPLAAKIIGPLVGPLKSSALWSGR